MKDDKYEHKKQKPADELDLAGADVVVDEEMVVGTHLGQELFQLLELGLPASSEPGHSQR